MTTSGNWSKWSSIMKKKKMRKNKNHFNFKRLTNKTSRTSCRLRKFSTLTRSLRVMKPQPIWGQTDAVKKTYTKRGRKVLSWIELINITWLSLSNNIKSKYSRMKNKIINLCARLWVRTPSLKSFEVVRSNQSLKLTKISNLWRINKCKPKDKN